MPYSPQKNLITNEPWTKEKAVGQITLFEKHPFKVYEELLTLINQNIHLWQF